MSPPSGSEQLSGKLIPEPEPETIQWDPRLIRMTWAVRVLLRAIASRERNLWLIGSMYPIDDLTMQIWASVTGEPESTPQLHVTGQSDLLSCSLAVKDVALASVSVALMAASAAMSRCSSRPVNCAVDRAHVAEAMLSERRFRLAGEPAGMGFASLSTFWRAADGWVRTHANYPWHRGALLRALGVEESADSEVTRGRVSAAMSELPADAVENRVFDQGGIAVRVRTVDEWATSEQGRVLGQEDLVGRRVLSGTTARSTLTGQSPAGGARVLDLTRVIAGPVCTRYLGSLGADVLRLDSATHPDMVPGQPADTLLGKRSAEVDFAMPSGYDTLHCLLDAADVLICGYRPGSLDRFGLSDQELSERHPGLVVVRLAAWGHTGPWAMRRGFDSIVQAATGIADAEALDGKPGVLPCQLLDHATGYLAAAAALNGLHHRESAGGTQIRTLSLARTAKLLVDSRSGAVAENASSGREPLLSLLESNDREVAAVAPPGAIGGRRLQWPARVSGYLMDDPVWL